MNLFTGLLWTPTVQFTLMVGDLVKKPVSHFDARGLLPNLLINALHHGLELLLRSALIELRNSILNHLLHCGFPQYWLHELLTQKFDDLRRIRASFQRFPSDIHVDLNTWRFHIRRQLLE